MAEGEVNLAAGSNMHPTSEIWGALPCRAPDMPGLAYPQKTNVLPQMAGSSRHLARTCQFARRPVMGLGTACEQQVKGGPCCSRGFSPATERVCLIHASGG